MMQEKARLVKSTNCMSPHPFIEGMILISSTKAFLATFNEVQARADATDAILAGSL